MRTHHLLELFCLLLIVVGTTVADEAEDEEAERLAYLKARAEAEAALDEAKEVVLQSISFKHNRGFDLRPDDYPILGEVRLSDEDRRRVVAAYRGAVADREEYRKKHGEGGVGCFRPRHAIRIEHNQAVYRFLICFECWKVHICKDGVEVSGVDIRDSNKKHSSVLNQILTDAKIELAPQKITQAFT